MRWSTTIDLTAIPTGADGKPDRDKLIELLRQQLADLQSDLRQQERYYDGRLEERKQDSLDVKRLRSYEVKVLQRWVRRRAIQREVVEHWALIVCAAGIAIPLFIVALAFAWRLAVWAVAG